MKPTTQPTTRASNPPPRLTAGGYRSENGGPREGVYFLGRRQWRPWGKSTRACESERTSGSRWRVHNSKTSTLLAGTTSGGPVVISSPPPHSISLSSTSFTSSPPNNFRSRRTRCDRWRDKVIRLLNGLKQVTNDCSYRLRTSSTRVRWSDDESVHAVTDGEPR